MLITTFFSGLPHPADRWRSLYDGSSAVGADNAGVLLRRAAQRTSQSVLNMWFHDCARRSLRGPDALHPDPAPNL
jgi:hypothetical protein